MNKFLSDSIVAKRKLFLSTSSRVFYFFSLSLICIIETVVDQRNSWILFDALKRNLIGMFTYILYSTLSSNETKRRKKKIEEFYHWKVDDICTVRSHVFPTSNTQHCISRNKILIFFSNLYKQNLFELRIRWLKTLFFFLNSVFTLINDNNSHSLPAVFFNIFNLEQNHPNHLLAHKVYHKWIAWNVITTILFKLYIIYVICWRIQLRKKRKKRKISLEIMSIQFNKAKNEEWKETKKKKRVKINYLY